MYKLGLHAASYSLEIEALHCAVCTPSGYSLFGMFVRSNLRLKMASCQEVDVILIHNL